MPEVAAGPDLSDIADRDLLVAAGLEAGALALGHFRRPLEITEKPGDQGPVTNADLAVDRALGEVLQAARPGYGWLSEETVDGPERLAADRVFIVDPIDGTRAFIAGEDGWCIALSVVDRTGVCAAAAVLPARGEVYAAARGAGATLDGVAIRASARADLEEASFLAAAPTLRPQHWPGGVPAVRRSVRSSLVWRLCLAAAGRYDALMTVRPCWEWDVAPGALMAAEAGLAVSDAGGAVLRYNQPHPRLPSLMAVPPAMRPEILRRRGLTDPCAP
ncbi:MAG: 3'(2'),5'-bisphosphate nucleotidase CysQ [Pseudomonadota bacterium]